MYDNAGVYEDAPVVLEVYSNSARDWFVAIVVREERDAITLRFLDHMGAKREKLSYWSDSRVARLGTHIIDLPPGVVAVPSSTRPGEVSYADPEAQRRFATVDLVWQAYLERHLLGENEEEGHSWPSSPVRPIDGSPSLALAHVPPPDAAPDYLPPYAAADYYGGGGAYDAVRLEHYAALPAMPSSFDGGTSLGSPAGRRPSLGSPAGCRPSLGSSAVARPSQAPALEEFMDESAEEEAARALLAEILGRERGLTGGDRNDATARAPWPELSYLPATHEFMPGVDVGCGYGQHADYESPIVFCMDECPESGGVPYPPAGPGYVPERSFRCGYDGHAVYESPSDSCTDEGQNLPSLQSCDVTPYADTHGEAVCHSLRCDSFDRRRTSYSDVGNAELALPSASPLRAGTEGPRVSFYAPEGPFVVAAPATSKKVVALAALPPGAACGRKAVGIGVAAGAFEVSAAASDYVGACSSTSCPERAAVATPQVAQSPLAPAVGMPSARQPQPLKPVRDFLGLDAAAPVQPHAHAWAPAAVHAHAPLASRPPTSAPGSVQRATQDYRCAQNQHLQALRRDCSLDGPAMAPLPGFRDTSDAGAPTRRELLAPSSLVSRESFEYVRPPDLAQAVCAPCIAGKVELPAFGMATISGGGGSQEAYLKMHGALASRESFQRLAHVEAARAQVERENAQMEQNEREMARLQRELARSDALGAWREQEGLPAFRRSESRYESPPLAASLAAPLAQGGTFVAPVDHGKGPERLMAGPPKPRS